MTRATYTVQLSTDEYAIPRGYWQYASRYNESSYFDTREAALDELFSPFGMGGYRVSWVGDGFALCAACARYEFEERDTCVDFRLERELMDGDNHQGIYCDDCSAAIVEPHCVDCGDDLSGRTFYNESGDLPICGSCLAKLVVQGAAKKSGFRTYTVPKNAKATTSVGITYGLWFDANTFHAENTYNG